MTYDFVYEEKYFAPGFIIYREDFKQFLKVFPAINEEGYAFTFLVSDEYQDNLKDAFRHITFEVDSNSLFYKALFSLLEDRTYYSIQRYSEGYNQMKIKKIEDSIFLTFTKDLTFSKNRNYNAMHLTVSGPSVHQFYHALHQLVQIKENEDSKKILMKMLNLQAVK